MSTEATGSMSPGAQGAVRVETAVVSTAIFSTLHLLRNGSNGGYDVKPAI